LRTKKKKKYVDPISVNCVNEEKTINSIRVLIYFFVTIKIERQSTMDLILYIFDSKGKSVSVRNDDKRKFTGDSKYDY